MRNTTPNQNHGLNAAPEMQELPRSVMETVQGGEDGSNRHTIIYDPPGDLLPTTRPAS